MEKCMEKEYIHGKIKEDIKGNILQTKSTAMANIIGLMAKYFKEFGLMEKEKERD